MYWQYNNILAESLPVGFGIVDEAVDEDVEEMDTSNKDDEEEELSSEDDLKKEIGSTIDYLIEHDKKELLESVKELQKDEKIIDAVTELEELIAMYLEESKSLEPESVVEKVHELLDKLSKSKRVQKSLLLKIKMLVNDIAKNRVRVREIVRRFNQAGDDSKSRLWIIGQLAKENWSKNEFLPAKDWTSDR